MVEGLRSRSWLAARVLAAFVEARAEERAQAQGAARGPSVGGGGPEATLVSDAGAVRARPVTAALPVTATVIGPGTMVVGYRRDMGLKGTNRAPGKLEIRVDDRRIEVTVEPTADASAKVHGYRGTLSQTFATSVPIAAGPHELEVHPLRREAGYVWFGDVVPPAASAAEPVPLPAPSPADSGVAPTTPPGRDAGTDAGTAPTAPEGGPPDAGVSEAYETAPPMEDLTGARPQAAAAPGVAGEIEQPPAAPAKGPNEVNGYVDSRNQFQRVNVHGLVPANQLPQLDELIEVNVQLKHSYSDHGFVYGDASAFGQFAGNFRSENSNGDEVVISPTQADVAPFQPLFSLNELYLSQDVLPQFNLTVGKKRILWGPGLAFNPTDLLNPPKDPTNPTFQRAGFWVARAEANLGHYAFTIMGAPQVTEQAYGLPYAFVTYPAWDPQGDKQPHYQLAARAYALIANADVNLMAFYGNLYNDAFKHKWRFGASFSRYFFTDYELHAEALFQQGSPLAYANGECVGSLLEAGECYLTGKPFLTTAHLDDPAVRPRVLVGTRRQFGDDSMLTIEYLFQNDGYTRGEFQRYVDLLDLAHQAQQAGIAETFSPFGGAASGNVGIPQNFTFNPTGKHYLVLGYSKPKIFDDWTVGLTVIGNLMDLSTLIAPSIQWSTTEWLTLSLLGFVPLPGPNSLAATTSTGAYVSEFSLVPLKFRLLFEARIFY